MIDVALALVPVIVFLAALFLMDTFRLVRPSWIVAALAYGALAAVASGTLNDWLGQPDRFPQARSSWPTPRWRPAITPRQSGWRRNLSQRNQRIIARCSYARAVLNRTPKYSDVLKAPQIAR